MPKSAICSEEESVSSSQCSQSSRSTGPISANAASQEPWSTFSQSEKYFIVGLASVAGFFSPLSTSIYFPAISTLAQEYHRSISQINLTVTVYMIFQGVVPALFTDLAENLGKRPVYLLTFSIYIAANIGLALQNSYGALLALRCLQSSGSSVTAALAISSASDVAKGSERGRYIGVTSAGLLIAPSIGPVIGGLLAGSLGWRAIFWFLAISGSIFLVTYLFVGQESARRIVGNGSIPPPKFNQSMLQLIFSRRDEGYADESELVRSRPKLRFPNPLRSLFVFKEKDLACILLYSSLIYAANYQMLASTVVILQETYGYNDTIIGVCYIPAGVGAVFGTLFGGRILDSVLKRYAVRHNFDVDNREINEESLSFPWEKARLVVTIPAALATAILVIGYGWVIQYRTPVAVVLVFQFLVSLLAMLATNCTGVMLVDSYPNQSATASAANNISRCLVGAGATAVIQPMLDAMGRGWCFTLVGLILIVFVSSLWPVWKYGHVWRRERTLRELK